MSSKKKKAWKSDSEHGAFLFLLYNFCVYDPNDYSEVEIYDHPDFPFKDNYCKKNFNTHCQTVSNRCKNYERRGNTLSRVFREFVDDQKIRRRPLFEQLLSPSDIAEHYSEEDDDGSYVDKSEDDLSFEADTEVGSLSALLRNQTLDISHLRDKGNGSGKTKKTKKKTTTTRKKPVQPPANIRKFCLFLLFLFRVLFISIY